MYFKQLQFLKNTVTKKERDPLTIAANSEEESLPKRRLVKRRKIIQPQQRSMRRRLIKPVKESNDIKRKCECSNQDEDKLFMLSLVNTLRRVPLEKKMATKIHIMSILDDATNIGPREHQLSPNIFKIEHIPDTP